MTRYDDTLQREPADPNVRIYARPGCRGRVEVHTDEEGGIGIYAIVGSYAEQPMLGPDGSVAFEEPDLMPRYMVTLVKRAFRDIKREGQRA
jgi:hypothetical protein